MKALSPVSPQMHSGRLYRPDIDGLRAVAILSVVLFHAGVPLFRGGFVGVDMFFVLSGLLIGSHVYGDVRAGSFTLAEFYRRRAKRILPALLALLAVCYILAVLLLSARELKTFGAYSIATILSGTNIYNWRHANYFAPNAVQNPLLFTWSLGIEEQFYLIFPLVLMRCAAVSRKKIFLAASLVVAISFVISATGGMKHSAAAFFLLPSRAWELLAGFLIAVYEEGRDARSLYSGQRNANLTSALGLVAILTGVLLYSGNTFFPGFAALLPVGGTVLLLASPASWINRKLLSAAPAIFIGEISYSLYLWHWPLISFGAIISDRVLPVRMALSIVAVGFGFALLSYYFIERPFRASKTPPGILLLRYAAVCSLALIPGLLYYASSGIPNRNAGIVASESALDDIRHDCWEESSPNFSPKCVNVKDPRPAVALVGDSHAEALASQLGGLASQAGFKLYELVKSACAPLDGVVAVNYTVDAERKCLEYNRKTLGFIENDPSIQLVILTAFWAQPAIQDDGYVRSDRLHDRPSRAQSDQNFYQGLLNMVTRLQAAGKHVLIVSDVPIFQFDPVARNLSNATPLRSFLVSTFFPAMLHDASTSSLANTYQRQEVDSEQILKRVAQVAGAGFFDPKKNLCTEDQCVFFRRPYLLYSDRQHLTPFGAQIALTRFPQLELLRVNGAPAEMGPE